MFFLFGRSHNFCRIIIYPSFSYAELKERADCGKLTRAACQGLSRQAGMRRDACHTLGGLDLQTRPEGEELLFPLFPSLFSARFSAVHHPEL